MWHKLLVQILLGLFLSSLYLTVFILIVHQQRTSYLSLTQAHSPQRFVNLSAEEINGRTLKAATAIPAPAAAIERDVWDQHQLQEW